MTKLFLFDIDGTLVTGIKDSTLTTSAAPDRFTQAIMNVTGLPVTRDKDFRGLTDYLILITMLRDAGWDDKRINAVMPELLAELDKVQGETFRPESVQLLPGVKDLLAALLENGMALGLLTGNLESVARRKLQALGIWDCFSAGGFGSDTHATRADLVNIAVARAGYQGQLGDVYVIGDTPKDIEAATEAGVENSVGVANGFRDVQELKSAGAKVVLEDFSDTKYVLHALGVEQ